MKRVSLETRDTIDRIETLVRVRTRDGQVLEHMGRRASLDPKQMLEKFRDVTKGVVSPGRTEAIARAIDGLDSVDDVRKVGALLAAE